MSIKNQLSIINVSQKYPDTLALDNINLELKPGVYGLIGANGSGKTTLIKVVTGLIKPTTGEVFYNGESIVDNEDYRSLIGLMPQNQRGYDNFTGYQLLWYMATLKGLDKNEALRNIEELIEVTSQQDFIHNKIKTYSGGMRQRLMLAQSLLGDPKIIFLDEPTAGLDPNERINIRNYISEFAKDRIVIIATHVMQDVESISNNIILIKDGQLQYVGSASEILDSINGFIFEKEIEYSEIKQYQKIYKVSNIIRIQDKVLIRFIDKSMGVNGAVSITPTLEEVYLHYLV